MVVLGAVHRLRIVVMFGDGHDICLVMGLNAVGCNI